MRTTLHSAACTTVVAALVLTGARFAAAQQDFDAVEMQVHPVAGQVYYIEGMGGKIGLFVGDDGVFLIDDQYAPLTDKIVAAVRTISDEPIRFLVNTHMHPDHTGGNENFGKMGTMIYGHDNMRTQMAAAGYEQEPPTVTYGTDMFNLPKDVFATQVKQMERLLKWYEPFEILKMATGTAGELFAMSGLRNPYTDGPLGVVKEGAYADLLLIDGNPLEDLKAVTDADNIKIIMRDGNVYKNTL